MVAEVEPEPFVDLVEETDRGGLGGDQALQGTCQVPVAPGRVVGRRDDAVADHHGDGKAAVTGISARTLRPRRQAQAPAMTPADAVPPMTRSQAMLPVAR